jgi:hypothetical protein
MHVARLVLPCLLAAAALAGCQKDAGGGGSGDPVTQALGTCLVNYWRTATGSCAIMPECTGSPTGDLAGACGAPDCAALAFSGYRAGDTAVDGNAIWSASSKLFCSTGVVSSGWSVADDTHIIVTMGAIPPQTVAASCAGTTANVGGTSLTSLPSDLAAALEARAAADTWTACLY